MAASTCTDVVTVDPRAYPDRPWVGVGSVVFAADGRVLLVRSGSGSRKGQWGLPGGAQHVGETVFEAAIREVREETGIEIAPRAVITVVDLIRRDEGGRPKYHYTLVDVLAEPIGGVLQAGDDADRAEWIAPDDLAALGMWTETIRIIEMGRTLQTLSHRERVRTQ
jgi:8-oxo-dGTP diphosphatase